MSRMLKVRAGFTLIEVMVALVLTAVIGAAVTGVFVTQSRFFDSQEKLGSARGVSRGAMNLMMSELRMLEQGAGVVSATNASITVRAPYAIGVVCGNTTNVTISWLPTDSMMRANAGFSGYAHRRDDGSYMYVEGSATVNYGSGTAVCTAQNVTLITEPGANGGVLQIVGVPSPAPMIGTPAFLYQRITYEFKNSVNVPGRRALWRRIEATGLDEELVAPFDTAAKIRFFVNDAATAQTAVPAGLNTITGLELNLSGLNERPDNQGKRHGVPLTTSVFFKNRPQ